MIILHHAHETRSVRILWLLHELDVPFEVVLHSFFDKSLRGEDYLAIHPIGRVPSLELGGQVILESGAMIELLCEQYPERGLGRLPGDPERAEWLQWLHFAETISQHTAALTQQHIMLYEDWMRSATVMKLEAKRVAKCIGALEQRLEGRTHLLSGGFSAVDIANGQAIAMARKFARLDEFPNVAAWFDRITARRAYQATLPPEGAETLYAQDFYEVPDA